jgi:TatD DNase family protein
MLVDSHCHLDVPDFSEELDEVVKRSLEVGVGHVLTICTHVTKFEQVLAVAERYDHIYCSVGIHPHNAEDEPEVKAAELIELAQNPKVVGIGETGLDFFYEHSPKDIQEAYFREHIKASRETGLPIIIHSRDAEDKTIEILRDEMGKGVFPGVLHCFSSDRRLAEAALEMGIYVSFSGILTFKKAQNLRDTAAGVPLDRLLVETDAPYLAPIPNRGRRNEPAFVVHTAQALAKIKNLPDEELFKITTENFFTLFSKAKPVTGNPPS